MAGTDAEKESKRPNFPKITPAGTNSLLGTSDLPLIARHGHMFKRAMSHTSHFLEFAEAIKHGFPA